MDSQDLNWKLPVKLPYNKFDKADSPIKFALKERGWKPTTIEGIINLRFKKTQMIELKESWLDMSTVFFFLLVIVSSPQVEIIP